MFPTIQRRLEITSRAEVELSPIENAVNTVASKTLELNEIIQKYTTDKTSKQNINPFTMVLKGVIDAAVSGGVELYMKAFFVASFARENPDMVPLINRFKEALKQQVEVLEKGLGLHKTLCSSEMAGLQEQLEVKFKQMKGEIERV
eukprot:TRINITY_DN5393_c0_g1_i1.p1 TRINITY_DN5393_c0_g1~~TRINITY_DN5393_c0_g1_i1.p1  ORF type:complete len:166 (-),score=52.47 TRINITY_DN5393_c0_g1_i1:91-528(-)